METKVDTTGWDSLQFEAYLEAIRTTIEMAVAIFNRLAREHYERFGAAPNVEPIEFPRPKQEMQRAHDLLTGLVLDPDLRDELIGMESMPEVRASLDVLCWCLNHSNDQFAQNIKGLEELAAEHGIALVEGKEPVQ